MGHAQQNPEDLNLMLEVARRAEAVSHADPRGDKQSAAGHLAEAKSRLYRNVEWASLAVAHPPENPHRRRSDLRVQCISAPERMQNRGTQGYERDPHAERYEDLPGKQRPGWATVKAGHRGKIVVSAAVHCKIASGRCCYSFGCCGTPRPLQGVTVAKDSNPLVSIFDFLGG